MSHDKEYPVAPAEVKATDPASQYSGRPNEWDKRQKQTGLEKKHETWVMKTLNFLQSLDIPFYTYHANGDRDPKRDKEIPERLDIVHGKYREMETSAKHSREAMYRSNARAEKLELELVATKATLLEAFDLVDIDDGEAWPTGALELLGSVEALVGKKEEDSDAASNPQPV